MKRIKVVFRGLGPRESVTSGGVLLRNGAAADMPEDHAKAYLEAGIAFEVSDPAEVEAAQALEQKNAETRKRIHKKVDVLRGGEKE